MSQLNVTTDALPPNSQVYAYNAADVPGVVASNNFVSLFNLSTSIKTIAWLAFTIHRYTIGTSSTATSMGLYRITAASGGTSVAASTLTKAVTSQTNSVMDVRTGNPTLTLLSGIPVYTAPPPLGNGVANVIPSATTPPGGVLAISLPGEGLAFNTAAGNVNQIWGFQVIWAEF